MKRFFVVMGIVLHLVCMHLEGMVKNDERMIAVGIWIGRKGRTNQLQRLRWSRCVAINYYGEGLYLEEAFKKLCNDSMLGEIDSSRIEMRETNSRKKNLSFREIKNEKVGELAGRDRWLRLNLLIKDG